MSNSKSPSVEEVREQLQEYEETHQKHDRRISRNENWRLQAQGALKVLALIVGSGAVVAAIQLL